MNNDNANRQNMISQKELLELADMHDNHCVSIFIPTHRAGEIFGIYNPSTREVRTVETHRPPNVSLMNLLAMMVLKTGGTVYLQEKENMPAGSSRANALYRY